MRPILGGQRREQRALQLRGPGNDLKEHSLAGGRQQYLRGTPVAAIVTLGDQRPLGHAIDHLAERAAIDPDMPGELGQRQRALLMQRQ